MYRFVPAKLLSQELRIDVNTLSFLRAKFGKNQDTQTEPECQQQEVIASEDKKELLRCQLAEQSQKECDDCEHRDHGAEEIAGRQQLRHIRGQQRQACVQRIASQIYPSKYSHVDLSGPSVTFS